MKPIFYNKNSIPINELSSDDFEKFICAVLPIRYDLEIIGYPSPSGDDGFDITAKRKNDGKIVCIQCKRYNSTSLNMAHLGDEFVKVALKSKMESSEIAEHFFITTNGIASTIESANREVDKKSFITVAKEALKDTTKFKTLRKDAVNKGINTEQTVESYIANLENIAVLSKTAFDIEMSSVWSRLSDVFEKYFTVHTHLREYPRPDFDEAKYLENFVCDEKVQYVSFNLIISDRLPTNIERSTLEDPREKENHQTIENSKKEFQLFDEEKLFLPLKMNSVSILKGKGGAGKTTALKIMIKAAAKNRLSNKNCPLPILVSLREYSNASNIKKLIEDALNIKYGNWSSLPGEFIIFFDGLNEASDDKINYLSEEINRIVSTENIYGILTVRDSGLRNPCVVRKIENVYEILSLNPRQVIEYVNISLPLEKRAIFKEQIFDLIRHGQTVFSLPFGLVLSVQLFKDGSILSLNEESLIDGYINQRFKRNRLIAGNSPAQIYEITFNDLKKISGELAFKSLVEYRKTTLSRAEIVEIADNSNNGMKLIKDCYGISSPQILKLLQHFEIIRCAGDVFVFEHDLIAGFLAAPTLAEKWQDCDESLNSTIADDAWFFAANKIKEHEIEKYLNTVGAHDLYLATKCALQIGNKSHNIIEKLIFNE